MNKISQAEKEIAKILQQLEIDTDCIVDQISIGDMDVTNIDSDRPVLLRCVRIETRRLPGSDWGTFHEA